MLYEGCRRFLREEGGAIIMMNYIVSFTISVLAGIVSYYICKWLDRN